MGYHLYRVNQSGCFGQGSFHTNTVGGLWSTIKRINNNFSGITFNVLEEITKNGGKSFWLHWCLDMLQSIP